MTPNESCCDFIVLITDDFGSPPLAVWNYRIAVCSLGDDDRGLVVLKVLLDTTELYTFFFHEDSDRAFHYTQTIKELTR